MYSAFLQMAKNCPVSAEREVFKKKKADWNGIPFCG
jgi:hypothetical protein